jgi:hypothetical protein
MVHTALLLPEVVAGILNAGSEETGLLYNCLLVNHLFLEEARRILWSKCDSTSGVHPDIEDLGAMILRDDIGPERAQIYANLIRDTSFHYGNSQSNHSYIDQTSWHTVLCQLKFPQLMSVWFWETDHGVTLNTEDVILHYAQSSLRKNGWSVFETGLSTPGTVQGHSFSGRGCSDVGKDAQHRLARSGKRL